jgi:ATP-dependent protease HslVU (ClpYQ) peptidase subunit
MTVIAALKADGKIYMGCDSIFLDTGSYQMIKRASSKLIVKEEMIIGMTTVGCRIFQIIQFKLKLPTTKKLRNDQLLEYISTVFCGKLFKVLHTEGMLVEDPERKNTEAEPSLSPASFLISIRDKMFQVGEDFDVAEIDMPFLAIGGGGEYAIGSLEATTNLNETMLPDQHLITAFRTAAKYNAGVRGPYQIINTEDLCLQEYS